MQWLRMSHICESGRCREEASSGTRLPLEVWRHISQIHSKYQPLTSGCRNVQKKCHWEEALATRFRDTLPSAGTALGCVETKPFFKMLKTAIGCSSFPRCHSDWADICSGEHNALCSPSAFFDHRAAALYHSLENVVDPSFFCFPVTVGEVSRLERGEVHLVSPELIGRTQLLRRSW